MKKSTLLFALSLGFASAQAQSTIPTTTVNGSLRITDSLQVTNDINTTGDISTSGVMSAAAVVASGEVTATDTMRAKKDIIVTGNATVGGDFSVSGTASFSNSLFLNKGVLFNNTQEFSYTPATSNTNAMFYLGNPIYKSPPPICPNPNTNALPQFINNGAFISQVTSGSGTGSTNASLSMYTAPWNGSGVIEVGGTDNNGNGNNGLLLNYFCHRNTLINTGWDIPNGVDGGTVFMGAKVFMSNSLKIGGYNSPIDLNTAVEIDQNATNGVKINTYNNSLKAFFINNTNFPNTPFVVYGDGKTRIGVKKPLAPHDDAMLGVDGKVACKSLFVLKPTSWADYVFKTKNNETLKKVEEYITKNKHLPNMPSEEDVMENGYDVHEMDAKLLSKIELLYLHIIELEKEVKQLKNK